MGEPTRRGQLFHWRRENGRVGEIDLVVECSGRIVPVETKSGAAGAMKAFNPKQDIIDSGVRVAKNAAGKWTMIVNGIEAIGSLA
jgi:Holliday junction resolvase-like predicted endonuclease